jgi:hypothetical protein
MKKEYYEEIFKKNKILYQVDTLGSFDFSTYIISLESLNLNSLKVLEEKEKIHEHETNSKLRTVLPLAVHEYTHFIDSSSTVWGINHLNLMNEAYLTNRKYQHKENLFYKAKKFHRHIQKIKYPNYYSVIGNIDYDGRWIGLPTMGKTFNNQGEISNETIMFMRFSTIDFKEIARTPISAVSILEASAMASEIFNDIEILNKLEDKEIYKFENQVSNKKILSFIYNKELTEYSACVHMVANQQMCTDILNAFYIVKIVTNIVLNSSEKVFEKILIKNRFNKIFNIREEDERFIRLKEGLESKDMGVLYYLIVFGLPEYSYLSPQHARNGISVSLKKLGLSFQYIKDTAKKEFNKKYNEISKTSISQIKYLAKASIKNFNSIDIENHILSFNNLDLPKVILNDFDENDDIAESLIFKNDSNDLSTLNLANCYEELKYGEKWVIKFSESCV